MYSGAAPPSVGPIAETLGLPGALALLVVVPVAVLGCPAGRDPRPAHKRISEAGIAAQRTRFSLVTILLSTRAIPYPAAHSIPGSAS